MLLIFTDLDGTLLDHHSYSWEPAREIIGRLRRHGIPWIFTTSKTRAEVEWWREQMGNTHPYIVENGGAAFFPDGRLMEWGVPYRKLLEALRAASRTSNCRVRGFSQMTVEEVSQTCQMPFEQALLAKRRDYDEPFEALDEARVDALASDIERQGLSWTRGGRFWHICGNCDKARAVEAVIGVYREESPDLTTVGLGDSFNDLEFLRRVDKPVLIRSAHSEELHRRLPSAYLTQSPGPHGWREGLERILAGGYK
jgi:mannosyl-3-phosphoglycerate phosphatase